MNRRLQRRDLLKTGMVMSVAGVAVLLAACSGAPAAQAPPSSQATKPAASGANSAASGASSAPKATAAPKSAGPVSLTMDVSGGGGYDKFVTKYNADVVLKQIPNVKIDVVSAPTHDEFFTKVLALQASGRMGDISYAFNSSGWLAMLTAKGVFANHDDLVQKDKFDLKQYFTGSVDGARVAGVLRSLPWHAHAEHWTYFFNLDAFEAAGVKPPPQEPPYTWNMEDEVTWGKALTKGSGNKVTQWGLSQDTSYLGIMCMVRPFGGDILSEDGKTVTLGDQSGRDAIKWMYDRIYTNKYSPAPSESTGLTFPSGKVAATISVGGSGPAFIKQIGGRFKMGVAAGPKGPAPKGRESAGQSVNTMGVTTSTKNPDLAWQVLKLHTDKAAGVAKVLAGAGAPGARPDCFEDSQVLKVFPGAKVLAYQLSIGWPEHLPWNLRGNEEASAIQQTLGNVWLNSATPDQGVDQTVAAVQNILKEADLRTSQK